LTLSVISAQAKIQVLCACISTVPTRVIDKMVRDNPCEFYGI
jgi:hypothetical protein